MYTQYLKPAVITITGFTASALSHLVGGYDIMLQTLLIFMAIDFISGIAKSIVQGIRQHKHTVPASSTLEDAAVSRLSSDIGRNGIIKKGCCFLMIIVAVNLDYLFDTGSLTRNAAIIAFILSELMSITENMQQMGINVPDAITNIMTKGK